jgi:iron-regulated transporter 1
MNMIAVERDWVRQNSSFRGLGNALVASQGLITWSRAQKRLLLDMILTRPPWSWANSAAQVVVIAGDDESVLRNMNSQMRRIDLFCKLASPLTIALIDGVSTKIAILVIWASNVASVAVEYALIAMTYHAVPALGSPRQTREVGQREGEAAISSTGERGPGIASQCRHLLRNLNAYFRHRAVLPSLSLSLLYLTVLSFSGQMITYLISAGYTSTKIGYIRSASVVVEMSATWLAPIIMKRLGAVRAGIWFLSWQTVCLNVTVGLFWMEQKPMWAASYLVVGVIASRIGLWGADLCAQIIIQEVRFPSCLTVHASVC